MCLTTVNGGGRTDPALKQRHISGLVSDDRTNETVCVSPHSSPPLRHRDSRVSSIWSLFINKPQGKTEMSTALYIRKGSASFLWKDKEINIPGLQTILCYGWLLSSTESSRR